MFNKVFNKVFNKSRFNDFMNASRPLRIAQFIVALVIFCYAALTPSPPLFDQHPETSLHFLGNVLLSLSAWLAVWGRIPVFRLVLFLLPFSLMVELAQYFSPGRTVDSNDMLVNITGLGVGALASLLLEGLVKRFLR
jgi:VanZ family protein